MPIRGALLGDAEIDTLLTDEADLRAILRFESALARAEAIVGLIPMASSTAIEAACSSFCPDWEGLKAGFGKDGVLVPELIRQLRLAVGEPHASYVHLGATSQDAIDTSLMLRLKDVLTVLSARLSGLAQSFETIVARDGNKPLIAHTRMQKARPFTVADKCRTWSQPINRLQTRLAELQTHNLIVQFGGPIGLRNGLNARGDEIAHLLAEDLGLANAPCWHSQRMVIAEFGAWFSSVSGVLGKFGQDIALMAQNERAEVKLASSGCSSSMADKSNPVGAEVLVALARFNAGLLGTLQQSLVHEEERSGAAWTLEWLVLPRMITIAAASLRNALALCDGLEFPEPDQA
jgi:3-carboxy-cis,cis-muconate cycloisomerase